MDCINQTMDFYLYQKFDLIKKETDQLSQTKHFETEIFFFIIMLTST